MCARWRKFGTFPCRNVRRNDNFRLARPPLKRTNTKGREAQSGVLVHESRRVPYRLYLGKRRGLRISVTPSLEVNVFAPLNASLSWVDEAVRERAPWIVRTLDKVASCTILEFPERFEPGAVLYYLNRPYRLAIVEGNSRPPELLFDTLVIGVPDPTNQLSVARAVKRWYRSRGEEVFDQSLARCLPAVARFGIGKPTVTIRNMRSRWGSCSSDGRVSLNLKLTMLPEALIDYVVMHEACHLVHHDHSKRFYCLLTECMPDWKERKKTLNRYRMK